VYTEAVPIVRAAQAKNSLAAALQYAEIDFSVLPLKGKIPSLHAWSQYQVEPATFDEIHNWHRAGLLENVGIVCGAVSNNLVVLDLDGPAGYPAFAAMFPHLAETFTVTTGGGVGRHVYLFADALPDTVRAMKTPIGHLELRANGCQVVAPPSIHPDTGQPYRVEKALDILRVPDLSSVAWIEAFKPQPTVSITVAAPRPPLVMRTSTAVRQGAGSIFSPGFKQWASGCTAVSTERYKHGDRTLVWFSLGVASVLFVCASGEGHLCPGGHQPRRSTHPIHRLHITAKRGRQLAQTRPPSWSSSGR
jgi:hypothetical protein